MQGIHVHFGDSSGNVIFVIFEEEFKVSVDVQIIVELKEK